MRHATFLQGIVNNQFSHVLALKMEDKPDSVVELINLYLGDVEAILLEFSEDMDLWVLFDSL